MPKSPKNSRRRFIQALRRRLVLTPQERRALCFVAVAFLFGAATKHYRAAHPRPLPQKPAALQQASKPISNRIGPPRN
jgi:hypothetical protein